MSREFLACCSILSCEQMKENSTETKSCISILPQQRINAIILLINKNTTVCVSLVFGNFPLTLNLLESQHNKTAFKRIPIFKFFTYFKFSSTVIIYVTALTESFLLFTTFCLCVCMHAGHLSKKLPTYLYTLYWQKEVCSF